MSLHAGSLPPTQESGSAPDRSKRRHWLPRWPWLLAIGLLTLGLVVLSLDELPSDASDLIVERVAVSDEENAFLLLNETAKASALVFNLTNEDTGLLSDIVYGKSWDEAKVAAYMTAFAPFWKRYQEAVEKPLSQVPNVTSLAAEVVAHKPLRHLALLSLTLARKNLREGNPDAAIETALVTMKAGERIQAGRGVLTSYITGVILRIWALEFIEDAVRHPDVSRKQLRALLTEIDRARDRGEHLANSLRGERPTAELYLEILRRDGPKAFAYPSMPSTISRLLVKIPVAYKPNKTRRLQNQDLRAAISLVRLDYATMRAETAKQQRALGISASSKFNPDNFIGRMALEDNFSTWSNLAYARLRHQSALSVYEAFVAARLYQQDHDALPASLDLLVPDYLPSVPKDYIDNRPIRYSPALGAIWSIGKKNLEVTSADQKIEEDEIVTWFVKREPTSTEIEPATKEDESPTPAPVRVP